MKNRVTTETEDKALNKELEDQIKIDLELEKSIEGLYQLIGRQVYYLHLMSEHEGFLKLPSATKKNRIQFKRNRIDYFINKIKDLS